MNNPVHKLYPLINRIGRYITVNSSSFIIDLSIIWILVTQFHVHYIFAVFMGLLVATAINYSFGRKWVFKGTTRELKKGYLIAVLVALVLLLIIPLMVWVFVEFFKVNFIVARLLTSIISGSTGFVLDAIFTYNMPVIPSPRNYD